LLKQNFSYFRIIKILIAVITFINAHTVAQIEEFDGFGYTVDSTFTTEGDMEVLYIDYSDAQSTVVGRIVVGFRDDGSVAQLFS
jgi:hypothetical protein